MARPSTPPTLRRHATGVFFVRWGGRDHYFSVDEDRSRADFLSPASTHPGAMVAWMTWRARASAEKPARLDNRLTVMELGERFLSHYEGDNRHATAAYFRGHLRRFLNVFGRFFTTEIDEEALTAHRADLLQTDLSPKTICHDLIAIKTMWRWGARLRLCPPLELSVLKPPRTRRGEPQVKSREAIVDFLCGLRGSKHAHLVPLLSLSYLCLLRPSEVVRMSCRRGRFVPIHADEHGPVIPRGLYQLDDSKSEWRTGQPRHVVMTDEAVLWFDALPRQHHYSRLDSFSAGVVRAAGGPGRGWSACVFRDSAASHLLALGVPVADVSLLLGHVPSGEWRSYGRPGWRLLR
jgi:site-specific recombinase XerD